MNRDIEAFPEQFLAWLLQSDHLSPCSDTKENFDSDQSESITGEVVSDQLEDCEVEDWEIDDFELRSSEVLNTTLNYTIEPEVLRQPVRPGDIPAVKDRFQALLKRRLQTEIQHNPPLFPWETEISDYEPDRLTTVKPEPTSERELWIPQQERIGLPVFISPKIFAQLLERSQMVALSSRTEKVKLVRAVEALFPGYSQMLDKFAEKVLTNWNQKSSDTEQLFPEISKFPRSYEGATMAEQMVLLLLAARQLIAALTLNLSSNQLTVERQWLTTAGLLKLEAKHKIENGLIRSVRIGGEFPCGGSLKLDVGQAQATSQRPDPGYLTVELFDLEPNQSYPLEVQFQQLGQKSLIFSLLVSGE